MSYKGINNVRGGTFCQIILNDDNVRTIKKMITSSTNKCFICGSNSHFARECTGTPNNKVEIIDEQFDCNCITSYLFSHKVDTCALNKTINYIRKLFDNENDNISKFINDDTKSSTKIINDIETNENISNFLEINKKNFDCQFCNKSFDTQKGKTYHENFYCKAGLEFYKNSKTKVNKL